MMATHYAVADAPEPARIDDGFLNPFSAKLVLYISPRPSSVHILCPVITESRVWIVLVTELWFENFCWAVNLLAAVKTIVEYFQC